MPPSTKKLFQDHAIRQLRPAIPHATPRQLARAAPLPRSGTDRRPAHLLLRGLRPLVQPLLPRPRPHLAGVDPLAEIRPVGEDGASAGAQPRGRPAADRGGDPLHRRPHADHLRRGALRLLRLLCGAGFLRRPRFRRRERRSAPHPLGRGARRGRGDDLRAAGRTALRQGGSAGPHARHRAGRRVDRGGHFPHAARQQHLRPLRVRRLAALRRRARELGGQRLLPDLHQAARGGRYRRGGGGDGRVRPSPRHRGESCGVAGELPVRPPRRGRLHGQRTPADVLPLFGDRRGRAARRLPELRPADRLVARRAQPHDRHDALHGRAPQRHFPHAAGRDAGDGPRRCVRGGLSDRLPPRRNRRGARLCRGRPLRLRTHLDPRRGLPRRLPRGGPAARGALLGRRSALRLPPRQ